MSILFDANYTTNNTSVTQKTPMQLRMSNLESDIYSSAFTVSATAEYKFETEIATITPSIGIRYTNINVDSYDISIDEERLYKVEKDYQEIWSLPLNIKFEKEFVTEGGTTITPTVNLGTTFNFGDLHATSKAKIDGIEHTSILKMQNFDRITFDSGVGLEIRNGDFSVGANYDIQLSKHQNNHSFQVNFKYEF